MIAYTTPLPSQPRFRRLYTSAKSRPFPQKFRCFLYVFKNLTTIICQKIHLFLLHCHGRMDIAVHGYIHIRVSQYLAEAFGIHSAVNAVCRKGMPQGMEIFSFQPDFLQIPCEHVLVCARFHYLLTIYQITLMPHVFPQERFKRRAYRDFPFGMSCLGWGDAQGCPAFPSRCPNSLHSTPDDNPFIFQLYIPRLQCADFPQSDSRHKADQYSQPAGVGIPFQIRQQRCLLCGGKDGDFPGFYRIL